MFGGFKKFILRGNVVDLAIGIVIGVAFGAVVKAFTDGILMAFIAAVFGKPNFDSVIIYLGDGEILIGTFLTALLNFVIVAGAIYFVVVVPLNKLAERRAAGKDADEPTNDERMIALLEQIAAK